MTPGHITAQQSPRGGQPPAQTPLERRGMSAVRRLGQRTVVREQHRFRMRSTQVDKGSSLLEWTGKLLPQGALVTGEAGRAVTKSRGYPRMRQLHCKAFNRQSAHALVA
jgi:hypothetical protein